MDFDECAQGNSAKTNKNCKKTTGSSSRKLRANPKNSKKLIESVKRKRHLNFVKTTKEFSITKSTNRTSRHNNKSDTNDKENDSTINSYFTATISEDDSEDIDVENSSDNDERTERRSKLKRKVTSEAAEQFTLIKKINSDGNTGKLIPYESPVRSSLSQKIYEVTEKSISSQSASSGASQDVLASESSVRSSLSQKIYEVTEKSISSQSASSGASQDVLASESSVRSSLSQKIYEVTEKSISSKSASSGASQDVLASESSVRSSLSQKIYEVASISSQSASMSLLGNSQETMNRTSNTTSSSLSNYSTPEKTLPDDQPIATKKKRKPKINKNWLKIADYDSYQAAFNDIKAERLWSVTSKRDTTTLFRCNRVKLRSEQCQSGLKIVDSEHDTSVSVYLSTNAHNCDLLDKAKVKLTDDVKAFIKFHFERGLKTKQIQDEFIKAKKPLPAKYLIENHMTLLRKQAHESTRFTLAEFKKLLEENDQIPEDDLTGYVVQHQINDDGKELKFNFVVSSKKLLRNNVSSRVCNADTTYKLIWQGYPVQITGFTDGNKKFHPSSVSVSSTENEADFTFIFNAIKEETYAALKEVWKPDAIMCDAAKAISNAFRNVFGHDIKELMCWFHAKCAMKDHVSTLLPKSKQRECINDIDKLQLSSNPSVFEKASRLFIEKYSEHEEFTEYFNEQWLQLHRNWYEGAAVPLKAPSCNNGLEVFNRTVKDEKTLRKRLPLQVFINQLLKWVYTWSIRYNGGANVIYQEPQIDLPLMTKSYQWTKQNKQIKKHPDGFFMVPAGKDIDLSNWNLSLEWETFDDFTKNYFLGWSAIVPNHRWIEGTCNCPAFLKQFICKHVVGIAIRQKLIEVPFEAKQIPLGQKRKRGRPKLAGKALVRD